MVLEGPLIHHSEVSNQGFVLAVLPFGKIQTRFCISWPTIQNHLGNQHCTVISPFKTTIASGFKWCINLYEKDTKSRRVKLGHRFHARLKDCPDRGDTVPLPFTNKHKQHDRRNMYVQLYVYNICCEWHKHFLLNLGVQCIPYINPKTLFF